MLKIIMMLAMSCGLVGCQKVINTERAAPTIATASFTRDAAEPVPPGVLTAINAIRRAALHGDRHALLSWISDDITISYGTDDDHRIFLALWEDDTRRPYHRFVRVFDELTKHGAAHTEDGGYLFPYFVKIETRDENIYSLMRVSTGDVRLTSGTDGPNAKVRPTNSLLCVDLLCLTHRQKGWLEMQTKNGRTVYARSEDLIPVANEYRLQFNLEQDGRYRLSLLVTAN